jgi:putative ABC transport system permease protein
MHDLALPSPAAVPPVRPTPPSVWRLAALQSLRDFRAGELRLVLVAVVLAVAALSAVGFFADRLQAGLVRDAAQLLGGDALVGSDHPTPPAFIEQAQRLGLRTATTATFPSMARAPQAEGGATRLVAVKAVSASYPLRGQLQVQPADGVTQSLASGPAPGTVWVDPAVTGALGLKVGDTLLLGDATLRIARLIVIEPDRGAGFANFAPRVMLSAADLPATGLVQPASRISYRLAVAAPDGRKGSLDAGRDTGVKAFVQWAGDTIKAQGLRGMQIETLQSGRPEMRETLSRAEKFLNLVALLSALLAAVAVAVATRDFAQRHLDDCAMLRVLGLSQRRIALAYGIGFAALGLAASAAGVVLGFALHYVFIALLGSLVPGALPLPGALPALFGLGVGVTLLLGFGLPPVLQLAQVPALRVIRRDVGGLKVGSVATLAAGAAGFAALLLLVARDLTLGLIAVGGFAAAAGLFALLGWLAVRALARWVPDGSARAPKWLVLATRQIAARPAFAVLQVASLAIGLMALALLVLLRTDLIGSWRAATPPDAPNRFVINIQPDQADPFQAALRADGVTRYDWSPMIRGRIESINGEPVARRFANDTNARRSVQRELNLSHTAAVPEQSPVVAGRWQPNEPDAISVEEGFAKTLGLQLGDRMHFDIGGIPRDARVTSLRKVDWGSMRVNFFVIFPLADVGDLPVSYIAAFRAPTAAGFDNRLSAAFPNITDIDISATLAQLQSVLDQVIRAVEFLFVFTLAAGLAVLLAAVSATREARAREFAVMRACGASASLLRRVQGVELLGIGALAGLLGTAAAGAVGWALARYAFEFDWSASPWALLVGTVSGAALALAAGWWSLREILARPVMDTLRRAGQL